MTPTESAANVALRLLNARRTALHHDWLTHEEELIFQLGFADGVQYATTVALGAIKDFKESVKK